MKIINYLSNIAIPITILFIVIYGTAEKNKVYDSFIDGAKSGMKIVVNIFPTLLGLFLAIKVLRESGIIDAIIQVLMPILNFLKIPSEIIPLAMLRPISGSTSTAVATDIMKKSGVDSIIGLMAATIMGATETTIYTIALYTSAVGIKKTRFVLIAALLADLAGIITAVAFWKFMS